MEDIIIKYLNQTATENEMRALLEWLDENIDNQRQFATTRDLWFASEASVSSRYGESANAFSRFRKMHWHLKIERVKMVFLYVW